MMHSATRVNGRAGLRRSEVGAMELCFNVPFIFTDYLTQSKPKNKPLKRERSVEQSRFLGNYPTRVWLQYGVGAR
jgi:hypothetical protein